MSATNDFMSLLEGTLKETGKELETSLDEVRQYAGEQMAQLALAVGEPGYDRAVIAARDNVLLRMGLRAVANADSADQRIIGIVQGALFFGAKAIAGGAA
jgi:hypothetical protein